MARKKLITEPAAMNDESLIDSSSMFETMTERVNEQQMQLFNLTKQADDLAEASRKKSEREKLKFQLLNGTFTSEFEEKQRIQKLLSDLPVSYEPKFSEFFPALAELVGWSDEEKSSYRKPPVAAMTINEVVYSRFSPEVIAHIHGKNPYISWCIRRHKNYRFLGEDGILKLEEFIYDAVLLMRSARSYQEFRQRHAAKFGTPFQHQLFD